MVRNSSDIGGLRDVRSMRSVCRRSMPRAASSTYLELYVLGREKERSEKETRLLVKRKASIKRRLTEIEKEMAGLEKLLKRPRGLKTHPKETMGGDEGKHWKTVRLDY